MNIVCFAFICLNLSLSLARASLYFFFGARCAAAASEPAVAVAAIDVSRASLYLSIPVVLTSVTILQMFTPYTKWQTRANASPATTSKNLRTYEIVEERSEKKTHTQFTKQKEAWNVIH